jgi:hypothetical protein
MKTHLWKLLVLVVCSTLMAEVLSGSTTWTRIQYLPTQFLLYGSAAIVIREIARKMKAGWFTFMMLGIAFGFILEGLVLQSIYNPKFIGNDISFGRAFGINWVWAMYMPVFHSIWSITGPILLTEFFFSKDRSQPWAGPVFFYIAVFVFIFISVSIHFIFIKLFTFNASYALLSTALIPILIFVFIGIKYKSHRDKESPPVTDRRRYAPGLIFLITYAGGALWYAGFATIFIPVKPPAWVPLTAGPVLLFMYFQMITNRRALAIDTDYGRLGLVAGLLLAGWIFGYFATESNPADHLVQLLLLIPIFVILYLLYRKFNKQTHSLHERQP